MIGKIILLNPRFHLKSKIEKKTYFNFCNTFRSYVPHKINNNVILVFLRKNVLMISLIIVLTLVVILFFMYRSYSCTIRNIREQQISSKKDYEVKIEQLKERNNKLLEEIFARKNKYLEDQSKEINMLDLTIKEKEQLLRNNIARFDKQNISETERLTLEIEDLKHTLYVLSNKAL